MEKVKTNIKGLDVLLGGGIPLHHHVFLCGGPGTGKTTISMEFLYKGALNGENDLYLSLEEDRDSLIENVKSVFPNWNKFDQLIRDKRILVITQDYYIHVDMPETGVGPMYTFSKLEEKIEQVIKGNNIKRVVIDSSAILKLFFEDDMKFRRTILSLLKTIKNLKCTTVVAAELPTIDRGSVEFSVEHFVADGVILLYLLERQEKRISAMEIIKMRGSEHSKVLTPFKITSNGVEVYVGEKVY